MKILIIILCLASFFIIGALAAPLTKENQKAKVEDEAKNTQNVAIEEFKALANELNAELRHFILDKLPQRVLQMDKLYQKCTEMQKNFVKREDNKHPTSELTAIAQEVGDLLTDLMIELNLLESKQLKLHCNVKLQAETLLSDELSRLLQISLHLKTDLSKAQEKIVNVQRDRVTWVRQLIKYPELDDQMLVEYDRGTLNLMRLGLAGCRNEGLSLYEALGPKVLELLTTENKDRKMDMNSKQNVDALDTSISYIYN